MSNRRVLALFFFCRSFAFCFFASPLISNAQGNAGSISATNKWGWRTITSAGIISGAQETRELFQLSGGVTMNRYFFGGGAGFDPYRFRSIPVFADARVYFAGRNSVFAYGNIGYNFPGHFDKGNEPFKTIDKLRGGLYLDGGLGYRLPLKGAHHISFSAGYSQKNMKHEVAYSYPCGIDPCYNSPVNTYVYDYKFGRVIVRLSWEWGK